MTYQNSVESDIDVRPGRVRFLAEIPISVFTAIEKDLSDVPNWDRYFILKNPPAWPHGMYDVISKHLGNRLRGKRW